MNRTEAFEHFKHRILDPHDHGQPLESATAYVTAGILTNGDYVKLCALKHPPAKKPFTPKQPKVRVKWDVVVDGRRGIQRGAGTDPETRLKKTVIEWIDPEPEGWMAKQLERMRAVTQQAA